ncbi:organic cation transporter protein-like [Penaeus vannamei]|uniref:organic cation transporter protein-like n=1 Tax=Penaeus vannamei TaxID=6689 RepID=UPI00387F9938
MAIKDFDDIFQHIGGFGRYQMILFAASCVLNVFVVFVYFGQIFMTLTPPHWCRPLAPLLRLNLSELELKALTIPRHHNGRDFLSCSRYDVNFTQVVESNLSWPDPTWPVTSCTDGWTYNFSLYYPTITSELDWVCDEDWRPALAQSLFFVGSMVGSPSLGWAADAWGRLPIIVFSNLLGAVAGIASAFSSSFVMFAALRFIVGLTYEQHYIIAYILLLEYVGSGYRTVMANAPVMTFLTLGLCTMPWMAWGLAHWASFALLIHGLQFVTILCICVIPESARWLLGKGRVDQAVAIITRAARVNRKALSPEALQEFKDYAESMAREADQPRVTTLSLLKTPVLRRRFILVCLMWMVMTVAYDGHTRNSENIGYDAFLSFTIAGAVEFPADVLTMVTTEWLGRRHTTVGSLVLSGLVALSVALVPEDNTVVIMGLAFTGRFLITMTMNVGHQYPVEILPTVARGQGMGTMQTLGFLSAFASPYIVYLSKYGSFLPYVILGAITVLGGVACLFLPETLHEKLPDTLEDGENFFSGQTLCYNPCAARSKARDPEVKEMKATGQDNMAFEINNV